MALCPLPSRLSSSSRRGAADGINAELIFRAKRVLLVQDAFFANGEYGGSAVGRCQIWYNRGDFSAKGINMQKETAFIAVAALFSLLSSALAANLRYTAVDDVRSWDNVSAWKCEDGLYGSLPQPLDNVSIDSGTVALPNFLRVTNGVTAAAYTLKLGALDGDASYAQSGKIIALKVESGGVLHTGKGEFDAISIGDRASGYGIVTIEGGMVSNQFITVGTKGIGVLTNDCGTIVQLGPELGSYGYLNVGFEQSATGTVVMTGGAVLAQGPSNGGNGVIDYDRSFSFKGGLLLVVGANGMNQKPSTTSGNTVLTKNISTNTSSYVTLTVDGKVVAVIKITKNSQSYCVAAFNNAAYGNSGSVSVSTSTSVSLTDGLYYVI